MEPADSIARLGFQKWYARQLAEGHAWLVTCLLCMVALLAIVEMMASSGSLWRNLAYGALAFAAGLVGWYALIRYLSMLVAALRLGERARCPGCGAHGRFVFVSAQAVRCRSCAREWRLID